MIGEARQAPGGGRMSVGQIERELGKLRANDDGTLALRSSVLNLIVVTDEESAQEITASVSKLAGRHPARAVVFIADPEGESNVDVRALCLLQRQGWQQRAGLRRAGDDTRRRSSGEAPGEPRRATSHS